MGAAIGFAAHFFNPGEETAEAGAFLPHIAEKSAGGEVRGGGAEKSFHAPLEVRAFQRAEAIAFGDEPVVAQGGQHILEDGSRKFECGGRQASEHAIGADTRRILAKKTRAMKSVAASRGV